MPELPEVETIRSQLAPLVCGRTIERVEILDPRWCMPLSRDELADALTGRRVEALQRRGKYLVWRLDGDLSLVQHLRMSAAILCDPRPEPQHLRVRIVLGGGRGRRRRLTLAIVDQRRFGTAQPVFGEAALESFFERRLGPEPFGTDFTAEHLWRVTRGRKAPIKALLLDQRLVAGIGNIYADEALFRAHIHPARPGGRLRRAQCATLREAILDALQAGIDAKGATIDDFRHLDGARGSFQDRVLVHRRAGEPCPTCGEEIVRTVVGGRATYFCGQCQPPPRGVPVSGAAAVSLRRLRAPDRARRSPPPRASP